MERIEFTSWCKELAQDRIIGSLGGLGGLEAEVSEGHPISPWAVRSTLANYSVFPLSIVDKMKQERLPGPLEIL
jgi:hypothetical protein